RGRRGGGAAARRRGVRRGDRGRARGGAGPLGARRRAEPRGRVPRAHRPGAARMSAWRTVTIAARDQLRSFRRAPVTTLLAMVLPLNLLLLMSLFALTGYNAPTGLVVGEDTPRAR